MRLVEDHKGMSKKFEGANGVAVLTKNIGNLDKRDRWSVAVVVNGKFKKLATRAEYDKAYAMAEKAIG